MEIRNSIYLDVNNVFQTDHKSKSNFYNLACKVTLIVAKPMHVTLKKTQNSPNSHEALRIQCTL